MPSRSACCKWREVCSAIMVDETLSTRSGIYLWWDWILPWRAPSNLSSGSHQTQVSSGEPRFKLVSHFAHANGRLQSRTAELRSAHRSCHSKHSQESSGEFLPQGLWRGCACGTIAQSKLWECLSVYLSVAASYADMASELDRDIWDRCESLDRFELTFWKERVANAVKLRRQSRLMEVLQSISASSTGAALGTKGIAHNNGWTEGVIWRRRCPRLALRGDVNWGALIVKGVLGGAQQYRWWTLALKYAIEGGVWLCEEQLLGFTSPTLQHLLHALLTGNPSVGITNHVDMH